MICLLHVQKELEQSFLPLLFFSLKLLIKQLVVKNRKKQTICKKNNLLKRNNKSQMMQKKDGALQDVRAAWIIRSKEANRRRNSGQYARGQRQKCRKTPLFD